MAQQMHTLSAKYMPDKDPDVFHMAGLSILEKLRGKWESWDFNVNPVVVEDTYKCFDTDVEEALSLFEQTCDYGSPSYGLPFALDLLYQYLKFVCTANKSKNADSDVMVHDDRYWKLHSLITETLEDVYSYSDLGPKATNKIDDISNQFHTGIMHSEYGKIIEHYQNQVDRCKMRGDFEGSDYARQRLVFARIHKEKQENPAHPFHRTISDPLTLMNDIEALLSRECDIRKYSDYRNHSKLYHYWMQLAKVLNVSVDRGLSMANQWMKLEDQKRTDKNPLPYYYVYVLQLLTAAACITVPAPRGCPHARHGKYTPAGSPRA
jgi:hypothetical protein